MAGDRDHVDNASAEVDGAGRGGPCLDMKRLLRGLDRCRYESYAGNVLESLVTGDVIAVPVRVDHHQRDALALRPLTPTGDQFLDHRGRIAGARAGIDQERALAAEQEIQE